MKWMEGIREEYLVEAASWTGSERRHIRMMRRYAAGMGGVAAALALVIGGIFYKNRMQPDIADGGIPAGKNFLGGKGALHCYVEGKPNSTDSYSAENIWLRDDENWYNVKDGILHPNGSITTLIPEGWEADPVWKDNPYYRYAADGASLLTDGEKAYLVQENKISQISDRAELTDFYTLTVDLNGEPIDGQYIHINAMRAVSGGWYWLNYSVDSSVKTKDGEAQVEWVSDSFDMFFNPATGAENRLTAQQNANAAMVFLQPAEDSSYYYADGRSISKASCDGTSSVVLYEGEVLPDPIVCVRGDSCEYLVSAASDNNSKFGEFKLNTDDGRSHVLEGTKNVIGFTDENGWYLFYNQTQENGRMPELIIPQSEDIIKFDVYGDEFDPDSSQNGLVLADDRILVRLPAEGTKHEQFAEVMFSGGEPAYFGRGYLRRDSDLTESDESAAYTNALGGQGEIRSLVEDFLLEDDFYYYELAGWNSGTIERALKSAIDPETHTGQWETIRYPLECSFLSACGGKLYGTQDKSIVCIKDDGSTAEFFCPDWAEREQSYPQSMEQFGDWYLMEYSNGTDTTAVLYNEKTGVSDIVCKGTAKDALDGETWNGTVGIRDAKLDVVYSDQLYIAYSEHAANGYIYLMQVDLNSFPAESSTKTILRNYEELFPQWWYVQEGNLHYLSDEYDAQQGGYPFMRFDPETAQTAQIMLVSGENMPTAMWHVGDGFCVVRNKTEAGDVSTLSFYFGYNANASDLVDFAELDTVGSAICQGNLVLWTGLDLTTSFMDVYAGLYSDSVMPTIIRLNAPNRGNGDVALTTATSGTGKKDSSTSTTTTTAVKIPAGSNFFGGKGEMRGLYAPGYSGRVTILEDDEYYYYPAFNTKASKAKLLAGSADIDFNDHLDNVIPRMKPAASEKICAIPNCHHDGSNPNCMLAKYNRPAQYTGIELYTDDLGQLYVMENSYIYRLASDGSMGMLLHIQNDSQGRAIQEAYTLYRNIVCVDANTLLISYDVLLEGYPAASSDDSGWVAESVLLNIQSGQRTLIDGDAFRARIDRATDSTKTLYYVDYDGNLGVIDKKTGAVKRFHVNYLSNFPNWMDSNGCFHYMDNDDARVLDTVSGDDEYDYFGGEVDRSGKGARECYGLRDGERLGSFFLTNSNIVFATQERVASISYLLHDGFTLADTDFGEDAMVEIPLWYADDERQIFLIDTAEGTINVYVRQLVNGSFVVNSFETGNYVD